MDKLFDSVNSSSTTVIPGKELRCAVTLSSPHWKFWDEALIILNSMKFPINVPTLKNWVTTITGIKYLCKKLLGNGFKFITLRSFNQDSVENLFCQVRSHGCRNVNPTSSNFQSSFKSLIINNLMSSQSVGANCENDNCENLSNFKNLLCTSNVLSPPIVFTDINIPVKNQILKKDTKLALGCQSYVAGAIIKKVKKITNNCQFCNEILTSENNRHRNIINARQYDNCSLQTPSIISINVYSIFLNEFNSHIDFFFNT